MSNRRSWTAGTHVVALCVVLLTGCASEAPDAPAQPSGGESGQTQGAESKVPYDEQLRTHRAEREERLRAEDGWLTVSGLYWLEQGESRFGSDPDNPVVLAAEGIPAWAGTLHYDGERVSIEPRPGVELKVGGQVVQRKRNLRPSDVASLDGLQFSVLARNRGHAVRVKDPEHPNRRNFSGIDYFPVDETWVIEGKLELYDEPRQVEVAARADTTARLMAIGDLRFSIDGTEHVLLPLLGQGRPDDLWVIFKDASSGKETYGAGRYLWATRDGETVTLDFNKAYNPPCAFTPYATCPLPPPGNVLSAAVTAGEKTYHVH